MKNNLWLNTIKTISWILGFFGALSFVRSISMPFNWYAQRIYGIWFNFGTGLSTFWLIFCLGMFAYSIWNTKYPIRYLPHHKADYSALILLCAVGFFAGVYTLIYYASNLILLLIPIAAYMLATLSFGELIARLRDKTLVKTLYWLAFFKMYPIWRPVGFFSFLLLASQLYLLIFYFLTPIRLFSLFAICSLTYFAAFLINLSNDYSKANEEKIKSERFKSELITNVSHDIKTPLTSIINYVDLLKKENLQGKAFEYIMVLDKKAVRLKVLIEDLLEASKAGSGNLRLDMQKINFGELVGQISGDYADIFDDRELTLVLRQENDVYSSSVYTDSRQIYRVLDNLFSNAAKYSLFGTRVFAETTRRDDKLVFVLKNISDKPIELSGSDLAQQFIRGDLARSTEGSGLGLYIAKSLIELLDGEFEINVIGDLFVAGFSIPIHSDL